MALTGTKAVKNPIRVVLQRIAQLMYIVIGISGILMIAMILAFQPKPNFAPGWCIIVLGILTVGASVLGFAGFLTTGCFICHSAILSLAAFGCGGFTLALFISKPAIARTINSRQWDDDKIWGFLSKVQWVFLSIFLLEILALVVSTVIHACIPVEIYENLEEQQRQRDAEMHKLKKAVEQQKTKTENTTAASLANKMRSKYGKWTDEDFGEGRSIW
ncbi:hypothetical protein CLOM_g19700 [Closterium sp. NIES-68]|nr:hypothetical protein CLOM_g12612 [Closterium sp. NIES-68]GJP35190.1 hypothetical protein CLOM_g19700 [Closterium sp. NIES-68]GJP80565.1 hypothetical protein CLOP_g10768 [Closterium sp. NIES-67]